MFAVTATPLAVDEIFMLTGHDACTKMGDYDVRIMNFSTGQAIDVCDVVEWKGYTWGITPIGKPKPRYGYFAFRAKD